MTRQGKGIPGNFSGIVGTMVGSTWNGISCMPNLPVRKKDHRGNTRKNLAFRKLFTQAINIQYLNLPVTVNQFRMAHGSLKIAGKSEPGSRQSAVYLDRQFRAEQCQFGG